MNIINDLIDKNAKVFEEEINFKVLVHDLETSGWTIIKLKGFLSTEKLEEILFWILKNIQGKCHTRNTTFCFENEKDAMFFMLKWQ